MLSIKWFVLSLPRAGEELPRQKDALMSAVVERSPGDKKAPGMLGSGQPGLRYGGAVEWCLALSRAIIPSLSEENAESGYALGSDVKSSGIETDRRRST
jgi:hypothetical protein